MSRTLSILALALLSFAPSCKKEKSTNATMVRDCTGAYLRIDGKDYHICNTEKTENIANGMAVKATYKKLKECNGTANDAIVCMMFHENEGWIEVQKITL